MGEHKVICEYINTIGAEIMTMCDEVVNLVEDSNLYVKIEKKTKDEVAQLNDNERKARKKKEEDNVFYLKMKGDYYRYQCELEKKKPGAKLDQGVFKKCEEAYKEAMTHATDLLAHTNPT